MGYNDEQQQDTLQSEAMRKIFVGGLNRSTAENTFFDHFSQYGEIVDKVIIVDPHTKESRGFGFITYSNSDSVENAFKSRPHTLDNKPLDIKRAMPREFNTQGAHAKTKKLFIGGITPDLTEEILKQYIESRHSTDFGKIETVFMPKDKVTGKNKGYGFIECTDNDFADRLAISESNCVIQGKKMQIKKAEPREGEEGATQGGGRGGRGGARGAPGGRGRGGGDRGRGFSRGGRGGGRGGYQNNDYGNNQQQQSYSTAYPMQQNTGGGYQQGGYQQQDQSGGYGGNYGGGQQQQQSYGQSGGYGGGAGAGGYGQSAGGYGQSGGYQQQGYGQQQGGADAGGYSQGGGGGYKGRGGGAQRGGAQRYQPY